MVYVLRQSCLVDAVTANKNIFPAVQPLCLPQSQEKTRCRRVISLGIFQLLFKNLWPLLQAQILQQVLSCFVHVRPPSFQTVWKYSRPRFPEDHVTRRDRIGHRTARLPRVTSAGCSRDSHHHREATPQRHFPRPALRLLDARSSRTFQEVFPAISFLRRVSGGSLPRPRG